MTDFGFDVSTFPDLDPSFALISGNRVLAEVVLRRWSTPSGMFSYDPSAGVDVMLYLNKDIDSKRTNDLRRALQIEAEKDERIFSCVVTLTFDFAHSTLTISAAITPLDGGTFTLVCSVQNLTIALLRVS